MKKKFVIISLFILSLILTGCSLTFKSSPSKKVENLLMSYKDNSDNIMTELDDYLKTLGIDSNHYEEYRGIYLKQYNDLKYEIKEETIDGDHAIVIAQIDVYDYYKIDNDVNTYVTQNSDEFNTNNVFDSNKVLTYKIDKLKNATDRVQYTITFDLTKVDDSWTIDNLSNEELEKIHGTYAH